MARLIPIIAAIVLCAASSAHACYETPGGMTVCPPIDDHLGPEAAEQAREAKRLCDDGTLNPDSPTCKHLPKTADDS